MSTEAIRLIRDGENWGGRGYGGGRRGRLYTYRYTVTTRMTCIKMGSHESHFNVSLIVRDKVTRPCPQTTAFAEKGEPKRYRTEVFPLGQTGSVCDILAFMLLNVHGGEMAY